MLRERRVGLQQLPQRAGLIFHVTPLRVGDPRQLIGGRLVPVSLPGLGEQDQRRGIRGLGRERKIQQDER
jgi:hypothetical protein